MKGDLVVRIDKYFLLEVFVFLLIIIFISGIGYVIFTTIEDYGYNKGFKNGWETQWNKTVNEINENGAVKMINSDGSLNMTIEKQHSCYSKSFFTIGNPYEVRK